MKIAITGHTAGIGKSFANKLSSRGHDIVGISKRDGNNIRNIPKIVQLIEECDLWINNAQSGYAQTELLVEVCKKWKSQTHKMVWVISTILARDERLPLISGMDPVDLISYRNQKRALEDMFYQLRTQPGMPRMYLVRPGSVATSAEKIADVDSADPDKWVETVVDIFETCRKNNLWPLELSLDFNLHGPRL